LNIFERKVYRRILGPVYDNEKENWRILTNKEICASVKNPLSEGSTQLPSPSNSGAEVSFVVFAQ